MHERYKRKDLKSHIDLINSKLTKLNFLENLVSQLSPNEDNTPKFLSEEHYKSIINTLQNIDPKLANKIKQQVCEIVFDVVSEEVWKSYDIVIDTLRSATDELAPKIRQ